MKRVKSVKPIAGYRLEIELEDGLAGTIDLSADLHGEVFEPLRDRHFRRNDRPSELVLGDH